MCPATARYLVLIPAGIRCVCGALRCIPATELRWSNRLLESRCFSLSKRRHTETVVERPVRLYYFERHARVCGVTRWATA
jgi:hypothetical protein